MRTSVQPGYMILAGLGLVVVLLITIPSITGPRVSTTPVALPIAPTATPPPVPTRLDPEFTGRASVIDGDTIEIHGARIRLGGIDAPESRQTCDLFGEQYRCGQKAANALNDLIDAQTVRCVKSGTDRYNRAIAKCFSNTNDLGKWMVSHGWAIAYRKYSKEYVADEDVARSQKLGIWAGNFTTPEEWRKHKQ